MFTCPVLHPLRANLINCDKWWRTLSAVQYSADSCLSQGQWLSYKQRLPETSA